MSLSTSSGHKSQYQIRHFPNLNIILFITLNFMFFCTMLDFTESREKNSKNILMSYHHTMKTYLQNETTTSKMLMNFRVINIIPKDQTRRFLCSIFV